MEKQTYEYIVAVHKTHQINFTPILPKQKKAFLTQWQNKPLEPKQYKKYFKFSDHNIGVVCGEISGVVCLDLDKKHGGLEWYEEHKENLGNPIRENTPNGGLHLYYRYPENIKIKSKKPFPYLEIKSDGHQVLTFPSQIKNDSHIEAQYQFANGKTLLNLQDASIYPYEYVNSLLPKSLPEPASTDYSNQDTNLSDILTALDLIPSDDREIWINIGIALKRYQSQTNIKTSKIWLEWSKKSEKYKDAADCKRVWESFDVTETQDSPITIASIFDYAQQFDATFIPPSIKEQIKAAGDSFPTYYSEYQTDPAASAPPTRSKLMTDPTTKPRPNSFFSTIKEMQLPDSFYYSCPAPIGPLTQSIAFQSPTPLPQITFATLLATIGYLKCGKYRLHDEYGASHPTNYIACFAPTSGGKGFPQSIMLQALKELNRSKGVTDQFKSVPSMALQLKYASRHTLIQVADEAANFFTPTTDHTPPYLRELHSNLNLLWSKNEEEYFVSGTKKDKLKDEVRIFGPKLNILNYSQPQNLYKIDLESSIVTSGLMPRFLVFLEDAEDCKESLIKIRPPKELLDYLGSFMASNFTSEENGVTDDADITPEAVAIQAFNNPNNVTSIIKSLESQSNNGSGAHSEITRDEISFTGEDSGYTLIHLSNEAHEHAKSFRLKCFYEAKKLNQEDKPELANMLGKTLEIALRVAVTIVDGFTVEADLMKWCTEFVYNNHKVLSFILSEKIGSSSSPMAKHGEEILKVMNRFLDEGIPDVSSRDLMQAMRKKVMVIGPRNHDQSLSDLVTMGRLSKNVVSNPGARASVLYSILD